MKRPTVNLLLDTVSLVHKAHRTIEELAELQEINRRVVRRYLRQMEAEGLAVSRREKRKGRLVLVYRWVPV